MSRIASRPWSYVLLLGLISGCQRVESPPQQDQHAAGQSGTLQAESLADQDPAEAFNSALQSLKTHFEDLKQAMEAETPDEAHDPLHELGHILSRLSELAPLAGLTKVQEEQVTQHTEEMYVILRELDDLFHHDDEEHQEKILEKYHEHADQLEQYVTRLQNSIGLPDRIESD